MKRKKTPIIFTTSIDESNISKRLLTKWKILTSKIDSKGKSMDARRKRGAGDSEGDGKKQRKALGEVTIIYSDWQRLLCKPDRHYELLILECSRSGKPLSILKTLEVTLGLFIRLGFCFKTKL